MEKLLSLDDALSQKLLKEHSSPIVSLYALGVAITQLYQTKEYAGSKIKNIRSRFPPRDKIQECRSKLMERGIIDPKNDFPSDCYRLVSSPFEESIDLACGLDPFCYVSHLSAMEYHGITDRFSKTIFLTTLPPTPWRLRAKEKMQKDLGEDIFKEYISSGHPTLTRHQLSVVNKSPVITTTTKYVNQGSYVSPPDRPIRISSIGKTFVDMLRKPDLCGGINHVIDVFKDNARTYLPLIINEVEQNAEPIEKVRAGYILEEQCGILNNTKIQNWVQFAQRGGSRVLDPNTPFWSTFSEKWCLSINVDI